MSGPIGRAWLVIGVLALVWLAPRDAMAYVGPGAGLSGIGALLAIVVAIFAAIFGFIWYPLKRLLSKRKKPKTPEASDSREP